MREDLRARSLAKLGIVRPTLLLDVRRTRRNIEKMAAKAAAAGVRFRPHFKTHQSAAVGAWFRELGVEAITVSSLDMARYFAAHGWRDITVAFPANVLERDTIAALAMSIRLQLVVDNPEAVAALGRMASQPVGVWIKVDVGYGRAGIPWSDAERIVTLARHIAAEPRLEFAGLLTHAGHSYEAASVDAVHQVHATSLSRMTALRQHVHAAGLGPCALSVGDTPCCSVAQTFPGADEIRPGNFVFYDLEQAQLSTCSDDDIAVAVACPVVSKSRERRQLVLYGGAVHLAKDVLTEPGGRRVYGVLATWAGESWGGAERRAVVVSVSQEHGLVDVDEELFEAVDPGDLVVVLPVHSCLTSDLYSEYLTLQGERLRRRQSNAAI